MRNKLLALMIVSFLFLIPLVSSEVSLWNNVIKDTDQQTVTHHVLYAFDDTSESNIGRNKDIPVSIYYNVQSLPYNLSYGQVDYCNLTIIHIKNNYTSDLAGFDFNVEQTEETQSLYFSSGSSNGFVNFNMRSSDTLLGGITCHYTDVNSLYEDNVLVGRLTTYMPSFECKGCQDFSLEELSNQIDLNQNITDNELQIYNNVQVFFSWNMMIWLILSWVIKIFFIIIAVTLLFSGIYYVYKYIKSLGDLI